MFKLAFARRIAFVLVAVLLAWLGFGGNVHAQDYSQCESRQASSNVNEAYCPSREKALEQATAYRDYIIAQSPTTLESSGACVHSTGGTAPYAFGRYNCYYRSKPGGVTAGATTRRYLQSSECPAGQSWNQGAQKCDIPCSSKPPLSGGYWQGTNSAGDTICTDGCKFQGDGTGVGFKVDDVMGWYYTGWSPTGETCSVSENSTQVNDTDGDGKSDGNDTAPNNPGQSGGGGEDTGSSDGGPQGNGPGEGSGNGNTSGGGGNCASPPTSTGDAILAQIAYQTWATRCAIEGAKDGNGNLKTTQGGSGTGTGDGEGEDNNGTDFGTSNPPAPEEFDPGQHKRFGIPIDASLLDTEAIFGAGTCPVLSVTVYGKTFSTSEFAGWCDLLRIIRALVLIFGAFTALRILMGHNA